jgi:hypothetical protein
MRTEVSQREPALRAEWALTWVRPARLKTVAVSETPFRISMWYSEAPEEVIR